MQQKSRNIISKIESKARERERDIYIYMYIAKVRFGAPLFIGVSGPKMAQKASYTRKLRATFPAERSKF